MADPTYNLSEEASKAALELYSRKNDPNSQYDAVRAKHLRSNSPWAREFSSQLTKLEEGETTGKTLKPPSRSLAGMMGQANVRPIYGSTQPREDAEHTFDPLASFPPLSSVQLEAPGDLKTPQERYGRQGHPVLQRDWDKLKFQNQVMGLDVPEWLKTSGTGPQVSQDMINAPGAVIAGERKEAHEVHIKKRTDIETSAAEGIETFEQKTQRATNAAEEAIRLNSQTNSVTSRTERSLGSWFNPNPFIEEVESAYNTLRNDPANPALRAIYENAVANAEKYMKTYAGAISETSQASRDMHDNYIEGLDDITNATANYPGSDIGQIVLKMRELRKLDDELAGLEGSEIVMALRDEESEKQEMISEAEGLEKAGFSSGEEYILDEGQWKKDKARVATIQTSIEDKKKSLTSRRNALKAELAAKKGKPFETKDPMKANIGSKIMSIIAITMGAIGGTLMMTGENSAAQMLLRMSKEDIRRRDRLAAQRTTAGARFKEIEEERIKLYGSKAAADLALQGQHIGMALDITDKIISSGKGGAALAGLQQTLRTAKADLQFQMKLRSGVAMAQVITSRFKARGRSSTEGLLSAQGKRALTNANAVEELFVKAATSIDDGGWGLWSFVKPTDEDKRRGDFVVLKTRTGKMSIEAKTDKFGRPIFPEGFMGEASARAPIMAWEAISGFTKWVADLVPGINFEETNASNEKVGWVTSFMGYFAGLPSGIAKAIGATQAGNAELMNAVMKPMLAQYQRTIEGSRSSDADTIRFAMQFPTKTEMLFKPEIALKKLWTVRRVLLDFAGVDDLDEGERSALRAQMDENIIDALKLDPQAVTKVIDRLTKPKGGVETNAKKNPNRGEITWDENGLHGLEGQIQFSDGDDGFKVYDGTGALRGTEEYDRNRKTQQYYNREELNRIKGYGIVDPEVLKQIINAEVSAWDDDRDTEEIIEDLGDP